MTEKPIIPTSYRELAAGELTQPSDLIWLAGEGPFSYLADEYKGPMYRYRPQPSPCEVGHFVHIRRRECQVWLRPTTTSRGRIGEQCCKPAVRLVDTPIQGATWMCARHARAASSPNV